MRSATWCRSALRRATSRAAGLTSIGGHVGLRQVLGGTDGEDAAAGADVGDQRDRAVRSELLGLVTSRVPCSGAFFGVVEEGHDEQLGFGAGDQDVGRDFEVERIELFVADEVGDRGALGAAAHQLAERGAEGVGRLLRRRRRRGRCAGSRGPRPAALRRRGGDCRRRAFRDSRSSRPTAGRSSRVRRSVDHGIAVGLAGTVTEASRRTLNRQSAIRGIRGQSSPPIWSRSCWRS